MFDDVVKSFGGIMALNGASFSVPRGITGLVGPNGSGKTTSIRILLGLIKSDGGQVRVFDHDPWRDRYKLRGKIGLLQERKAFPKSMTGKEYLEFVAKLYRVTNIRDEVRKVLELVGLPEDSEKRIGGYSAGMLQRLGIACALVGEPEFVILDEPTANLDPLGRMELLENVKAINKELGASFLVSSHILPELEVICEQIILVHNGRTLEQSSMEQLSKKYPPTEYKIVCSEPLRLIDALRGKEFIKDVSLNGNTMYIKTDGPRSESIGKIAAEAGLSLEELEPRWNVLERAYRQAIGGA